MKKNFFAKKIFVVEKIFFVKIMKLLQNISLHGIDNPKSNLVYYFCSTKFNKYISFNNFMGNNENTYFTNGAKNILILEN